MEKFITIKNKFTYGPRFGFGPLIHYKLGKPIYWFQNDNEETFNSNWQNTKTRAKLEALNWSKDSIEYRRNDAGFRMDINMSDIIPGECDFYLGCSHTFGTGINLEDTWCWKMSLKKGLPCVNLGWSGGGIEVQYRLLKSWAEILRPKKAYTLGFFMGRREILVGNKQTYALGHWNTNGFLKLYETVSNEDENIISAIRSFDAMRSVCMDYDIELYTPTNRGGVYINNYDANARDLMHNSPSWHSAIANMPDNLWERLA
jgi:hypothetical protein